VELFKYLQTSKDFHQRPKKHTLVTQTNIYLADDHELVAQGLASLIHSAYRNCTITTFKNGKQLFDATLEHQPDLIFLDYEMPVWDGKTALIALRNSFKNLPILMLSMINEKSVIEDCMKHGASGFVNKDCSVDEFKLAIKSVLSGSIFYSVEVIKVLSGLSPTASHHTVAVYDLTDRELDVLRLLCEGLSPREIGEKLFLSPRTIEKHKDNIMQKFELNSVARLIAFALKNKIV